MAGASTSIPNQFVVPGELLTFDNYKSWEVVMRRKLERLHLWSYIDSREENRIHLRKDKKILDAIKKSCDEHMLPHIMYADFARDAWDWLAEAAAWTDAERGNYVNMLVRAATAKSNTDEVPEVDKVLTRRNYTKWKIYMKNILLGKYLWAVVEGTDIIGTRSYQTKNHNALVIIRMSCGEEMFLQIDEEDNAKDAWCKLERKLGSGLFNNNSDKVSYDFTNELLIGHELLTFKVDHKTVTISSNYDDWVLRMKNYLINHELWGFLEELEISDCVKDEKALDAIKASCAPEMRANILYMNCAKDAWYELTKRAAMPTEDEERNKASEHSEAGKVLTRNNYQKWEEYVTMLLRSRFLYDVLLPYDHDSYRGEFNNYEIKEACALRIIKEACGPEMMPYIFRSKSPGDALTNLRKACSMDQQDDYMKYSRLLHAVKKNGFRERIKDLNGELWRGAHNFFRDFPEALTAEITEDGCTALHVAVQLGRVDFVRELLSLMPAEQTELKTHRGNTAIAVAAGGNNMEIVKMLIESNPHLPLIGNENELHAVTIAAINGNEMIMYYLYPFTSKSTNWWGARSVASFLTSAARLNAFGKTRVQILN
ncbi:hypothetical protein MKW98_020738 [Papaver atlanticum]|uniref:DUF4219 domain-containing protein n=1 Tax=Papaver atlanticum TaxID=357466 RepID=A0AAD4TJT4_9MAGN|nr:hypothetical protein MKW98_020738 [Papaver atlanticum]